MHDSQENPLQFENEVRKLKMEAETGSKLFTDTEKITPKQESDFLDYIEAFDRAAEKREYKKVKEILGNPALADPKLLGTKNLTKHLEKAYKLLNDNNISLDVLYDVPDAEVYRFIVEDLMEFEMSVIDVPDLVTCFTYEEFYPNDKEDLKRYTQEFVEMLAEKSFEFMNYTLHKTCNYQDTKISSETFVSMLEDRMAPISGLDIEKLRAEKIKITKDHALLTYLLKYKIKLADGSVSIHEEKARFGFTHDLGFWYLQSVSLPSLKI